jgi:WD40 repeat protein
LIAALATSTADAADVAAQETPVGLVKGTLVPSITVSPDARHVAYIARDTSKLLRLYLDGKPFDVPVDAAAASGIAFSPDGNRMAAIVGAGNRWTLVVDRKAGKSYEAFVTGSLTFSPDGSRVAVIAAAGEKRLAVIDGQDQPQYDDVKHLAFSRDGKRFAYAAKEAGAWRLVTELGPDATTYDEFAPVALLFSPDGKRIVHGARVGKDWFWIVGATKIGPYNSLFVNTAVFSPDGSGLATAGARGIRCEVVIDGDKGEAYDDLLDGSFRFSADGSRYLFAARQGLTWVAVVDGKPGPAFDGILTPPVFSADGKRVAFVGSRPKQQMVVVDGKSGLAYDQVLEGPLFSPDGARVAYAARVGKQQFVVINDQISPPADAVGRLTFAPDGRLAYAMQRKDGMHLMLDGKDLATFDGFLPKSPMAFDARGDLHAMTFRAGQFLAVTVPNPGSPSSAPTTPKASEETELD